MIIKIKQFFGIDAYRVLEYDVTRCKIERNIFDIMYLKITKTAILRISDKQ